MPFSIALAYSALCVSHEDARSTSEALASPTSANFATLSASRHALAALSKHSLGVALKLTRHPGHAFHDPSKGRMPATRGSTTMAPARDYSTACSYEQDRARVARLNLIVHHVTVSLIGRLPGSTLHHTASGTERSTLLRPNSHHATQICPSRYASLAESVQLRRKRLNDINRPIVRGGTRG
jgi:hypothetical protein